MKIKCLLLGLICVFSFSCMGPKGPSKEEISKRYADSTRYADSIAYSEMKSNQENGKKDEKLGKDVVYTGDSTTKIKRKFVRTAELKYQVKDVRKASNEIEELTNKYDGFITYSYLSSSITSRSYKNISSDSILENVFYTVTNVINLRVPNTSLDSLLKDLNKLMEFLDYKILKADDVSMLMFSNDLNKKRIEKHQKRITDAIDNKGKKLNDIINAEDNLLNKQEQSDYYKTSNMNLNDQIAYSTVKMNIYQREIVKRSIIENFDNIKEQKPGFFLRIWDSIKIGWGVVEDITVDLFMIWWLILIFFVGWYILVRSIKKSNKIKEAQKQNNAQNR